MFLSPIVIMAKVLCDASWVTPPLRPVMDANSTDFAFRLSFDITNDENVWSGIAGGLAVVPYYMMKNLADVPMLRGLFLAGVVGASTSTVSSIVNSHAAIFYIDVVTPYVKLSEKKAVVVMRLLAFASGTIMTLVAIAVPYLGTAARLFFAFYSSTSGPFSGLILLALSSPWVNGKQVIEPFNRGADSVLQLNGSRVLDAYLDDSGKCMVRQREVQVFDVDGKGVC
ncbi:hypothetical protein MTO96_029028 [Rhipicephalus appendiculatus]